MKKLKYIIISIISIIISMSEECFAQTIFDQTIEQTENNNALNWAAILIPSFITVVGLVITNINTKRSFTEALKQKNNDQKREVYTAAFNDIDELVTRSIKIFDSDYFDKVVSHKAKIKLCGSPAVIKSYEEVFYLCLGVIRPSWEWIVENHPKYNNDLEGLDACYTPEDYERDCQIFEEKYKEYKENHLPEKKMITEKVETLLNEMRKDLGNEVIIH